MPEPGNDLLRTLVEAVADGQAIDWNSAESTPMGDAERSLLAELRVLEGLYRLHRSSSDTSPASAGDELHTEAIDRTIDSNDVAEQTSTTIPAPIAAVWGRLQIREMLGSGGFGIVYRAWDPHLESEVALKVLTRETARAGAAVVEEARLLARVRHPNVVSIYGADRVDGEVGLWMELVRGRTLKQIVRQQGPFGAHEAALVGLDLTRALAAVHGAGLVHRDVKPHNVMRDERGRIILMDFGAGVQLDIGGRDRHGKSIGTPLYMAPELFDRMPPSAQTDIYSLGILLYHIVTGAYPIEAASPSQVQWKHERGERRHLRDIRPDLPSEFVRIVERAIDPVVATRYKSAGELERDLAHFLVTEGRASEPQPADRTVLPRRTRQWAALAGALVVSLVILGAAAVVSRMGRRSPDSAAPATIRSIVVLPFRNSSADPAQEYFVDGMTEVLTADLSGVSSLKVIADSAARTYRGTKKPISEIARELHVDGVVEGSVARSGDRVRVTVQVVHAGTNLSLWGSSFERQVNDAFQLQADIARALMSQLRAALTTDEIKRLAQTYTASPQAQDLYLRGEYALHRTNKDGFQEARALLERAVQLDPNFALAWSSLSRCYAALQDWGLLSPDESRRLGLAAARRALEIDPLMYEAHKTMAEALFKFEWNWRDAESHYRQALDANPSFTHGRTLYARFLAAAGRVDDAVAQARLAEQSDPVSVDVKDTLAMMLVYQRRYGDALAKADEAIALDPNQQGGHVARARALTGLQRFDDAIRELQEGIRLSGGQPGQRADLGRLYALTGHQAEAEAILDSLSRRLELAGNASIAQDVAYVQIGLDRFDYALTNLERAVDERSERVLWLRVDPKVDPLRGNARFEQLIRRIGGLD
jgi:serine/threonine protein kinase/tetratricopeptide (TPR) repeat protein